MTLLADLIVPRTKEQVLAQLIQALQGVGFVHQYGEGSGTITLAGIASMTGPVQVKIATEGEIGVGTCQYSLDSGVTWSTAVTIPSTLTIPLTGVVITFVAGTAPSFIVDTVYGFNLAIPTFPVTSWATGSVPRTLIEIDADALSDVDSLIAAIAKSGFSRLASGPWKDLWAESMYQLSRGLSIGTKGYCTLTDTGYGGPFTISPNQLWVATASGKRYNNVTGGTLTLGGTLSLLFVAESPGASYNVGIGAISVLVTSLPGVTVTNPSNWLTLSGAIQGVDAESDELLQSRMEGKWSTLGAGNTADAYDYWAKTATTKTAVYDPPAGTDTVTRTLCRPSTSSPGTVEMFLAGSAGAVSATTVTTVDDYIQPLVELTSVAVIASASNQGITITGTVKVLTTLRAAAEAAAETAIEDLFRAIPIGGAILTTGLGVSREAIIAAIMQLSPIGISTTGVTDLDLTAPATDVILTDTEIPIPTINLTWSEI